MSIFSPYISINDYTILLFMKKKGCAFIFKKYDDLWYSVDNKKHHNWMIN